MRLELYDFDEIPLIFLYDWTMDFWSFAIRYSILPSLVGMRVKVDFERKFRKLNLSFSRLGSYKSKKLESAHLLV